MDTYITKTYTAIGITVTYITRSHDRTATDAYGNTWPLAEMGDYRQATPKEIEAYNNVVLLINKNRREE